MKIGDKIKERRRDKRGKKRKGVRKNSHQPLQGTKLDALDPLPQSGNLLLDPRLRFLDLKFLNIRLFPDPSLFEIQIQPDARLRASDLISESRIQFCQIVAQPLVTCPRQLGFGRVRREEFGTEFGEIDFLRVGASLGIFAEDHRSG